MFGYYALVHPSLYLVVIKFGVILGSFECPLLPAAIQIKHESLINRSPCCLLLAFIYVRGDISLPNYESPVAGAQRKKEQANRT